ncbi:MAG: delta-60 repeat domain-containing protein [Prosthecobacter sp.]|uniref:delta-60 repeat domain-containing protein n=1 Tax=Prosthecobacter sp. TaxID=1965333 RepID=UPI0019E8094D|nr:delta-60 repeat domain-containing protein [Prosthecobacter sp.]MBE2282607.1 delta-60 repeat domain-containing protein [Prosthecobacter sp.]
MPVPKACRYNQEFHRRINQFMNAQLKARPVPVALISVIFALLVGAATAPAAPGDVDTLNAYVVGSTVFATAVQPDGKTIIAGAFTSVFGFVRNNIARLNATKREWHGGHGFQPQPKRQRL